MAKFLLVFCPQQQGIEVEQIKKQLRHMGAHQVQQETNCETGLEQLMQERFDFIIAGSSLADDAGAVVENGGGLRFCQQAREQFATPMLLLAPALTSELMRETAKIANLTTYADPGTAGGFALELLQLGQRVEPCLAIRVTASEGGWRFDIDGIGFKFQREGELSIKRSAWKRWEAQRMFQPDWYTEFSDIGESIRIALCDENPNFTAQRELGRAAAIQQLGEDIGKRVPDRITFVVTEAFYPLMLEAVFDPSLRPEPWLAQASSVARRLFASQAAASDDLFTGSPAARRALLICANTHGSVFSTKLLGGQVKLEPLTSVKLECTRVRKLLTKKDPRTGQPLFYADNIKVLGLDGPVTRADLNAAVRDGTWDLIHFAGHTCFQRHGAQQAGGTGFLFIGPPDEPECVDFGEISSFMRNARFVYLSSCESGNSGFATLAAAADIQAVLGYRCRVNDRTAAIQALLFYRLLLRSHSLGTAFGLARRRIYQRYGERDNAWASAMLVTPEFRT